MTLSELRNDFRRDRIQDPTEGTWLDTDLDRYINRAQETLANDTYCCERLFRMPVLSGQYQYMLPLNFLSAHTLYQLNSSGDYLVLNKINIQQLFSQTTRNSTSSYLKKYAIWGQQPEIIVAGQPTNMPDAPITELEDSNYNFDDLLKPPSPGADRTLYRIIVENVNPDNTVDLSEAIITSFSRDKISFSGELLGGISSFDANNTYYQIEHYSGTRESLYVSPVPNWTDEDGFHSVVMLFYALPQTMEYNSDRSEIPDRWREALLDKAEAFAWTRVGDTQRQDRAESRYLMKISGITAQRELSQIPSSLNIRSNRQQSVSSITSSIDIGDYNRNIFAS